MKGPYITKDKVQDIIDKKFLRVFDLQYAEGAHYFDATRRGKEDIVAIKSEEEFKTMLPDAVSCVVIVHLPGKEPKLLLSYEYRYPAGRFLLSVPAGRMDPEDKNEKDPIATTAIREIHEETGIVVDLSRDKISVINPFLFSSPGLTDESNALVKVELYLDNLDQLDQTGCDGSECFDGFSFITKDKAKELLVQGRDEHGHFYSVYTWAALMYFVSDMWK